MSSSNRVSATVSRSATRAGRVRRPRPAAAPPTDPSQIPPQAGRSTVPTSSTHPPRARSGVPVDTHRTCSPTASLITMMVRRSAIGTSTACPSPHPHDAPGRGTGGSMVAIDRVCADVCVSRSRPAGQVVEVRGAPTRRAVRHRIRRGTTDRCWTSPALAFHAGAVPTSPGPQAPRGVLAVLCVAQFVLILDVAVVNVALVPLAGDLGVAADGLQVVASAYAACFGGALLLGGRLADSGHRRTTFLVGLVLFAVASLVCGVAGTVAVLVAGRAAQGLGAALASPAAPVDHHLRGRGARSRPRHLGGGSGRGRGRGPARGRYPHRPRRVAQRVPGQPAEHHRRCPRRAAAAARRPARLGGRAHPGRARVRRSLRGGPARGRARRARGGRPARCRRRRSRRCGRRRRRVRAPRPAGRTAAAATRPAALAVGARRERGDGAHERGRAGGQLLPRRAPAGTPGPRPRRHRAGLPADHRGQRGERHRCRALRLPPGPPRCCSRAWSR